jgi:hypothetical protein
MYSYRNDLQDTNVVSDPLPVVASRLQERLDEANEPLAAVIKGVDHLWDVSLMAFIYGLTASSVGHNVSELAQRHLFDTDRGVPRAARARMDGHDRVVAIELAREHRADLGRLHVAGVGLERPVEVGRDVFTLSRPVGEHAEVVGLAA